MIISSLFKEMNLRKAALWLINEINGNSQWNKQVAKQPEPISGWMLLNEFCCCFFRELKWSLQGGNLIILVLSNLPNSMEYIRFASRKFRLRKLHRLHPMTARAHEGDNSDESYWIYNDLVCKRRVYRACLRHYEQKRLRA